MAAVDFVVAAKDCDEGCESVGEVSGTSTGKKSSSFIDLKDQHLEYATRLDHHLRKRIS
jgi:hypothetical protein